jgi:hypothetical protein
VVAFHGEYKPGTITKNYLAVIGENTVWPGATKRAADDITDEPSATILLLENSGENVHWMDVRTNDPLRDLSMWIIKWLSVPVLVIAVATWLAAENWLENGWVMLGYGATTFLTLLIWRRATDRLLPTFWHTQAKDLEPALKRKVTTIALWVMYSSLVMSIAALLAIILCAVLWDQTGLALLALSIMVVNSLAKVGVLNVLIRRMLDRELTDGQSIIAP